MKFLLLSQFVNTERRYKKNKRNKIVGFQSQKGMEIYQGMKNYILVTGIIEEVNE